MENIEAYQEMNMSAIKPVFPLWAKDKINALKNLQIKITDAEWKFFEEIQDLERKYMSVFNPLFDERMKILTGEKEKLSEEETKWNYEDESIYEAEQNGEEKSEAKKNLPGFWLQALKSTKMISEFILEHDEPVFEHLTDIRYKVNEQKPYGYTIEFHFSENEYFTNKVLTKTYELICEKDANRPFLLAKGHFYKCKGCTIDWKKDKNLTPKTKTKNEIKFGQCKNHFIQPKNNKIFKKLP